MNSSASLKEKLVNLLIKSDIDLADIELESLRKENIEAGMDEKQFNQVLQECVSVAQWKKRKKEKESLAVPPESRVSVLGEYVVSLYDLGRVLFDHPDEALEYLTDDVLLKTNVTGLTNNDVNKIFKVLKLYKSETEPIERYLKIVYYLNPALPYRIDSNTFADIRDLFIKSFENHDFYLKVYAEFESGRIQLWLRQINADDAAKLPDQKDYACFLAFVYSINAAYPFYIKREIFWTPAELAAKALNEACLRDEIADAAGGKNLLIWLTAIEQAGIARDFQNHETVFEDVDVVTLERSVQTLLNIINGSTGIRPEDMAGNTQPPGELTPNQPAGQFESYFNPELNQQVSLEANRATENPVTQEKPKSGNIISPFINFVRGPKGSYFLASMVVGVICLIFFYFIYRTSTHSGGNKREAANSSVQSKTKPLNDKPEKKNLLRSSDGLYSEGNNLYQQKNYLKAFEMFKKSDAITVNAKSECMIGNLYYMGLGVNQSDSLALKWYLSSARQKNPSAMYSLGLLYANGGKGVKKDVFKAYQYLTWVVENANDETVKNSAKEKLRSINEQ